MGAHTGSLGKESGYRKRNEIKQNEKKKDILTERKKGRKKERKTHIITKGTGKVSFRRQS